MRNEKQNDFKYYKFNTITIFIPIFSKKSQILDCILYNKKKR